MTSITKYLAKTNVIYDQLNEDSQKLSQKIADDNSPILRSELSRINKQLVKMGPENRFFLEINDIKNNIETNKTLMAEIQAEDPELADGLEKEIKIYNTKLEQLETEIADFLVSEEQVEQTVTMEVKAAAGGSESALFSEDVVNMYLNYFVTIGFKSKMSSYLIDNVSTKRACKHAIFVVTGTGAYNLLKHEIGVHKVQRVPITEKMGRVHSSTCQVLVYQTTSFSEEDLDERDIKTEVMRASGAGGQHVNKTESAVRVTHLPTGIQVYNADERDQHSNRANALAVLKQRVNSAKREEHSQIFSEMRSSQMGSGNLNERIRTYNWPDSRVTGRIVIRSQIETDFAWNRQNDDG